ncbi:hypothetical protein AWZ03_015310 [Drosophila navojoa]|uniref:Uncharacterized protein n=1 Tax=Drosophila navojoa TaxID=7232 RepID=A0A484ALX9_DRONA|nr:hypothetical protein AWZ03_015310 [Drosophila navojoa]
MRHRHAEGKKSDKTLDHKKGARPPARAVKRSEDLRGEPEERPPDFRSVELEKEGEPGGSSPTGEASESEYGGNERSAPNSKEWPDELEEELKEFLEEDIIRRPQRRDAYR